MKSTVHWAYAKAALPLLVLAGRPAGQPNCGFAKLSPTTRGPDRCGVSIRLTAAASMIYAAKDFVSDHSILLPAS
ncbi:hypothetical protein BDW74DRAFT_163074, partial [Aspergillus multicolor]|uniref:uncharacterized protein n=1 Tax=Aspergillus multicolor TaxID=41759 RepID=UPI003CCDEDEA